MNKLKLDDILEAIRSYGEFIDMDNKLYVSEFINPAKDKIWRIRDINDTTHYFSHQREAFVKHLEYILKEIDNE